jgi:hypothetical protein
VRGFFAVHNKRERDQGNSWGQPLGLRSSGKKRYHSIFFKSFLLQLLELSSLAGFEPAFSFFDSDRRGPKPIVTIRSVSHLVLAPVGLIRSLPPNLNRKERAGTGDFAGSVSAPFGSVFLRQATH